MAPLFDVVYLFSGPNGYLAEICRLDREAHAPKSETYQWLWLEDRAAKVLRFVAMASGPVQLRTFQEGQLSFDDQRGELRWADGESIMLVLEKDKDLPAPITQLVNIHLS